MKEIKVITSNDEKGTLISIENCFGYVVIGNEIKHLRLENLTILTTKRKTNTRLSPFTNTEENIKTFSNTLKYFSEKYNVDIDLVKKEMQKFIIYWTEKNPNGKKEKWEKQKTFDFQKRFLTWFNNFNERNTKTTKQIEKPLIFN